MIMQRIKLLRTEGHRAQVPERAAQRAAPQRDSRAGGPIGVILSPGDSRNKTNNFPSFRVL